MKKTAFKTIKEIKAALYDEETKKNTLLGAHLVSLESPGKDVTTFNAGLHLLEIASEVIKQMEINGIDVFKDRYKLGNVSKAFYQVKLSEYDDFQ